MGTRKVNQTKKKMYSSSIVQGVCHVIILSGVSYNR